MTSALSMLRDGVGKLETLSDLCALAQQGNALDGGKRSQVLEEAMLASRPVVTHQHQAHHDIRLTNNTYGNEEQLASRSASLVNELTSCLEQPHGQHQQQQSEERRTFITMPVENRGLSSPTNNCSSTIARSNCATKTASSSIVRSKKADQPQRIKRPMNPFMIWAKGERSIILNRNPTMHNSDVSRQLGRNWRSMSDEEKQPFIRAAEQLAEEHRRKHPDYKYRPRKKDPNVQRVRGRRLDSDALNRVTKALTQQEINECVSGCISPLMKRAPRPSSMKLSSTTLPFEYAFQPSVDTAAEQLEKAAMIASAPVTPVMRESPEMIEQHRQQRHYSPYEQPPSCSYRTGASERGWYSCPPSPSSYSEKPYSTMRPAVDRQHQQQQRSLETTPMADTPLTEGFNSPPPLVNCSQYQPATPSGNCPPPLRNRTIDRSNSNAPLHQQQQQNQHTHDHVSTGAYHEQPGPPPMLSHGHLQHEPQQPPPASVCAEEQSYQYTMLGHVQQNGDPYHNQMCDHSLHGSRVASQQSSPVQEYAVTAQHSPPHLADHTPRHISPPCSDTRSYTSSTQSLTPDQFEHMAPSAPSSRRSSQVSNIAQKLLTVMVKRTDENSTPDGNGPYLSPVTEQKYVPPTQQQQPPPPPPPLNLHAETAGHCQNPAMATTSNSYYHHHSAKMHSPMSTYDGHDQRPDPYNDWPAHAAVIPQTHQGHHMQFHYPT
ncbi:transcription factor SOX-9-like [Sycon ciliatum]|uniref:transcription factor SOX-9-like n=1 Tax=Sycon ciliatum TaxID=27933 RepID=UPI0031F6B192